MANSGRIELTEAVVESKQMKNVAVSTINNFKQKKQH